MTRHLRPLLLAAMMTACYGVDRSAPFTISRLSASAGEVDAISGRVQSASEESSRDVLLMVATAPATGFTVVELPSGRPLGQSQAALTGRPHLAGDLVVGRTAQGITAWRLDATEAWHIADDGYDIAGVSADGGRVAITLGGSGVTRRRGSIVVVESASGRVLLHRRADHAFGVPALVGDDLFVPWDGQNLSVFSVRDDAEIARLRSRDDVINFARREGRSLFFGARSLYRFEGASASGRRETSHAFTPTAEGLPGDPGFTLDGYTALRGGLDARERVRLVWRADPDGNGAALQHGKLFSLFHREVFAIAPDGQRLHWAYVHPNDIVAAEVVNAGVVVADETGQITLLEPNEGRPIWRVSSGAAGSQADLQVGRGFTASGGVEGSTLGRLDGIAAAASAGNDARMVPAQRYAVRALGGIEDAGATRALVAIVTRSNVPPEVMSEAAEALGRRTNGSDAVLEALQLRYDFVRGTAAPPVGILARAVASTHETRAIQPLLAHLFDPATPIRDLPPITTALRALHDASAVPGLADFVRRYHIDVGAVPPVGGGDAVDERDVGEQDQLTAALEQATLAVNELGGAPERALLERLANHPLTPAPVRTAATTRPTETTSEDGGAVSDASDMSFAAPVTRLTVEQISDAFQDARERLLNCVRGAPSRPAQVRIQFRYDAEGHITQPLMLPTSFGPCMAPIVESVTLPTSGASRELGTYYLTVQ